MLFIRLKQLFFLSLCYVERANQCTVSTAMPLGVLATFLCLLGVTLLPSVSGEVFSWFVLNLF